jgi:hypothetical protein
MLPECYIYVYDIVRDEKRWINKSYADKYPNLYSPITYHGITLESELLPG